MRKLKRERDQIDWKGAGLQRPAPRNKKALKLALVEIDLPPAKEPGKVVLP